MTFPPDHTQRIVRARRALTGLSIGDAFGDSFRGDEEIVLECLAKREVPPTTWEFSDDTIMGISVLKQLEQHGAVDQDNFAAMLAHNYQMDPYRGYGGTAHSLLRALNEGKDWRDVSPSLFDGMGSMGNGAAMRVAPIGAYFAEDAALAAEQARLSAEVTHYHAEGQAGAIAVAVAAVYAVNAAAFSAGEMLKMVVQYTPESDTRGKLRAALALPGNTSITGAVAALGNGVKIMSQDTVPLALWIAAHYGRSFEEALWLAVAAGGDKDTICAIVGSISGLYCAPESIPVEWKEKVESWEGSEFYAS